jgi:putative colanic acid biosynthesis acetyltransferase WcaF
MSEVTEGRKVRNYSRKELFLRVLWVPGSWLFRLIPKPLHELRCLLIRLYGAKVGRNVHLYPSARITYPWLLEIGDDTAIGDGAYLYNLQRLRIGRQVTISQRAHLCGGTHDYRSPQMPLIRATITIEDQAWVCAEAFIGPFVTVGEGAVIGARAVVLRDLGAWDIVTGNPARKVKTRTLHSPKPPAGR